MRRREFITLLGGAVVPSLWPRAARAQQPAMPVIGFLNSGSADGYRAMVAAFRRGLQESGYVEGTNVAVEYRWAEGHSDRLSGMAAELVRRRVAVLAATTTAGSLAAKAATATIPIVFETGGDPVRLGLVASLSRPGGNVTGATQLTEEAAAKLLEILHELLPAARDIALLINPVDTVPAASSKASIKAAADSLGLELHILNASSEAELERVFPKLTELRVAGLVIGPHAFFTGRSEKLGALTAKHGVPAIYKGREFAAAGGLASYGSDTTDSYRLAGSYVGRILKGEKPADLPVQQATKIEFYLNLKTAKALGITVPLPLSGLADEVIE